MIRKEFTIINVVSVLEIIKDGECSDCKNAIEFILDKLKIDTNKIPQGQFTIEDSLEFIKLFYQTKKYK